MSVNIAGGALDWEASINMGQFERDLLRMERGLNNLADSQRRQAAGVENFAKRAQQAAAGFLSVTAAYGFVKQMVAVRGEFQQISMAFTTMLKSKEAADRLMAEAVKLAAITPFTLKDVAGGAKQLLAYGFAAGDVTKNLTNLGNIAAGVGSQLTDIVYLYGTLKASGRVTQMDINQFAGRGIPIYEELAAVMKINVDQVRDYVSAGKIGFKEVEQAFSNLTGPAGKFFNLMESQSKSLTGKLSNLEDAWDRMLNSFGEQNEGLLNSSIDGLIDLVDNYEKVLDIVKILIITYGAYRAAVILNTLTTSGWGFAEGLTIRTLILKEAVVTRLTGKMALMAGTTAALTAALASLGAITYAFIQYSDAAELSQDALTEGIQKAERAVTSEKEKIDGLIATIRDQTKTKVQQKAAYDALILATGEAYKGYTQEEIAAGNTQGAIEGYTKAVYDATKAQSDFAKDKEFTTQINNIVENGEKAISTFDQMRISLSNFGSAVRLALTGDFSGLAALTDKKKATDLMNNVALNRVKDAQKQLRDNNPALAKKIADEQAELTKEAVKAAEVKKKLSAEEIRAAKKYNDLLKDRNDLEREITQGLADVRLKTQSEEEQIIAAINKKYEEQIRKVDELNAKLKPADQIYKKDIRSAQMFELGVAGVDAIINGPGGYKEELDKKQKLFTEYEAAKTEIGADFAKKQYQAELGEFETYYDYVKKELESLKNDKSYQAVKKREIIAPQFVEEQANERKKYQELLKEFMSYNDQRKLLTENYNRDIALLENDPGARAVRTEVYTADLNALDDANVKKLDAYKQLLTGIENISDESAQVVVGNAQLMLDALVKDGKISISLAKEIQKVINTTKKALKEKLPDRLIDVANQLDKLSSSVKFLDNDFSKLLSTAANIVGEVGNIGKGIQDMKAAQSIGGVAGAFGQLSAGLGILTSGLSIVEGIFNFFDKSAERAAAREKQQEYQRNTQLKQIDASNKALERQIELINEVYGTERLNRYSSSLAKIAEEQEKYRKSLEGKYQLTGQSEMIDGILTRLNEGKALDFISKGFFDIFKTVPGLIKELPKSLEELRVLFDSGLLDEGTAKAVEQLIRLEEQAKETENALIMEKVGVGLEDVASKFIATLTDGIQDFGATFEDVIKTALLKGLTGKFIETQLQKFYDMLADFSTDGLTPGEIKTLRDFYIAASEKAKQDIKDLEAATGIKLTDDPPAPDDPAKPDRGTGLAGRIEAITHDDADKLAGLFNGFRLTQMETNGHLKGLSASISVQQGLANAALNELVHIQINTFRTANNTDKLSDININLAAINEKMGKNADALAATGRGPI